jgi:hypothetical protein
MSPRNARAVLVVGATAAIGLYLVAQIYSRVGLMPSSRLRQGTGVVRSIGVPESKLGAEQDAQAAEPAGVSDVPYILEIELAVDDLTRVVTAAIAREDASLFSVGDEVMVVYRRDDALDRIEVERILVSRPGSGE